MKKKELKKLRRGSKIRPIKTSFIQDTPLFKTQTFVMIGYTKDELIKKIKKYHDVGEVLSEIEKIDFEHVSGFVIETKSKKKLLFIRSYSNQWTDIDTLTHEIHHLVYFISEQFNFKDEPEAQAYLYEYLFHEITAKLNNPGKLDKNK
jgi:hypothetical protein